MEIINSWLRNNAGKRDDGKPYFRIVWSPIQVEKRFGAFTDRDENTGCVIRNVVEVRETKKYKYLAAPCWVLERWVPTIINPNDELIPEDGGTWEPFWCFLDKHDKAIEPTLEVVQFIIHRTFNPLKLTPQQQKELDDVELKKEVSIIADSIDIEHLKWDVGYTKEMKNVDISSG
jgi:hypothetical protein